MPSPVGITAHFYSTRHTLRRDNRVFKFDRRLRFHTAPQVPRVCLRFVADLRILFLNNVPHRVANGIFTA